MTEVTLEFLGQQMTRMFEELRTIHDKLEDARADINALRTTAALTQDGITDIRDDLRLATAILLKHETRITRLEQRP